MYLSTLECVGAADHLWKSPKQVSEIFFDFIAQAEGRWSEILGCFMGTGPISDWKETLMEYNVIPDQVLALVPTIMRSQGENVDKIFIGCANVEKAHYNTLFYVCEDSDSEILPNRAISFGYDNRDSTKTMMFSLSFSC